MPAGSVVVTLGRKIEPWRTTAVHRSSPRKRELPEISAVRADGQQHLALQFKETHMKRSVLLGLFVTASLLASPGFAGNQEDLCEVNLQTIRDARTTIQAADLQANIDATVQQAQAAQAKNTEEGTKECIALTTRAIQTIQNSTKGEGGG